MMQLNTHHLTTYLRQKLGHGVELISVTELGDHLPASGATPDAPHTLKTFGYGRPLLVRYRDGHHEGRVVINTVSPNAFGHEYRSDRAANIILGYDSFNDLPQHVPALDVGVVMPGGRILSLGEGDEFFLLMPFIEGSTYAHDLKALRDGAPLTGRDVSRARALARYLGAIHADKRDDPALYRRHLRDLVGSGEGIMGLADSYPPDYPLMSPRWLETVEQAAIQWRWRLRQRPERLSRVHGDFHPFNILFQRDLNFTVLDRSRGPWGEPADDVTALTMNYIFFSLQKSGRWEAPFTTLWYAFWETYMHATGDDQILQCVAPFFAWRALVVASPVWYHISDAVRYHLFAFVENVLTQDLFDPSRVDDYLLSAMQIMS